MTNPKTADAHKQENGMKDMNGMDLMVGDRIKIGPLERTVRGFDNRDQMVKTDTGDFGRHIVEKIVDKLETASAHNSQLQGRVEPGVLPLKVTVDGVRSWTAEELLMAKIAALESSLSAAKERLREIGEGLASIQRIRLHPADCICPTCEVWRKLARLAVEDAEKREGK